MFHNDAEACVCKNRKLYSSLGVIACFIVDLTIIFKRNTIILNHDDVSVLMIINLVMVILFALSFKKKKMLRR